MEQYDLEAAVQAGNMENPNNNNLEAVAVAQPQDVDALHESIRANARFLDGMDETTFANTPLHDASSAGRTRVAIEIMILKSSLGSKLNPDGCSPLHLALQNGHFETVKRLIKFDRKLIRVKGREGLTPLHCVAKKLDEKGKHDHIDILAEFLCACPESIQDLTSRDETAIHIAVKNSNLEAFKVLMGWLRKTHREEVLFWTDEEGNTVLHLAVTAIQPEMVSLLVERAPGIKNKKNMVGVGALDIALLRADDACMKEIENILVRARASRAFLLPRDTRLAVSLVSRGNLLEKVIGHVMHFGSGLTLEMRNVILVVAALVATATFQALLTPPPGVSLTQESTTSDKSTTSEGRYPSISLSRNKLYYSGYVYALNTIAFTASINVIVRVLPYFSALLHLSLLSLMGSYGVAMYLISRSAGVGFIMLTLFILSYAAFLFHVLNVRAMKRRKKLYPWLRKPTGD